MFGQPIHRIAARLVGARFAQHCVDLLYQWPWIYPRGIEHSLQEWLDRRHRRLGWYSALRDGWVEHVEIAGLSIFEPPLAGDPGSRRYFNSVTTRRYASSSVCLIKGAHLVSKQGMALTPDNRVLSEFYHEFAVQSLKVAILKRPFGLTRKDIRHIAEPIGLLAAPQGWNYYHWLFDVLPRLHLLDRWKSVISRYAIPSCVSAVQLESLELLGVHSEQLLPLEPGGRLRCQQLFLPSLPGSEGCSPPWVLNFLRTRLMPAASSTLGGSSRLYLQRGSGAERPILNEAKLTKALEDRGYQIVSMADHSMKEQIALIRDASIIVSSHGAALANLVFADNASVLELFSADYARADCYFTLCNQRKLHYDYWIDSEVASKEKPWGAITVDVDVIVDKLCALETRTQS